MQIILFGDIHGNLVALDTMLRDAAALAPDGYVCLGDVAEFGPQPVECLAQLRDLGCPVVMGNTDIRLLDKARAAYLATKPDDIPHTIELWNSNQLGPTEHAQISSFQPTISVDLAGTALLCFHGTPTDNRGVVLATTSDDELDAVFAGIDAPLLAGGHTHRQLLRRHGPQLLMNPGSVGATTIGRWNGPRYLTPFAEYAVLTVTGNHRSIDFRRVPVDLAAMQAAAHASGMPHPDWWCAQWR